MPNVTVSKVVCVTLVIKMTNIQYFITLLAFNNVRTVLQTQQHKTVHCVKNLVQHVQKHLKLVIHALKVSVFRAINA